MGAQWKVINANYKNLEGYKRVAWPPASEERIVREFTPQPQTQYQPAPACNQQYQPTAATNASTAPPSQAQIYNNVQHNTNSLKCEINSPYTQDPNENDYEAFPPQTPETPIILKDKQFSRLPSQEPIYQQPQNQTIHQQHYKQEQPTYNQQSQYQYHSIPNQSVVHTQQQPHQYQMKEEHPQHHVSGWKPIRPPQTKQEYLYSGQNAMGETTPVVHPNFQQQQYQNYQQFPNHQQQQYRAPSYGNYQQQQQQSQYTPQPQYQNQAPQTSQNLYQQPPQTGPYYQQQPPQQPDWVQQQTAPQQPQQQQYQQPPWVQQPQQQQYQAQQQQPQYQNPLNQNQAPYHNQQQQQQYPLQQNQFVPQTNQQQFNSYSQPQQQQHTVSHDQVDQQQQQQQQHYPAHLAQDQRGASPGIITLRKEAPITQKPAPIYTSQPAAISFRESSTDSLGGSNMRGDLKWPPPEYKEAAVQENEERRKLALGPVCRPRKVNRDYTSFFAKNALSHHYPSYKVPPGTQHMVN